MRQREKRNTLRVAIVLLFLLVTAVHPTFSNAETVDEWLERKDGQNESNEERDQRDAHRNNADNEVQNGLQRSVANEDNDEVFGERPPADGEVEDWSSGQGMNIVATVLQLVFYLVLILGLIYGLAKFIQMRQRKIHPHRMLRVMGGVSFGPNRSVQLIRVGRTYYLIGVGDSVQLIREIDDEADIHRIEKEFEEQETAVSKNFQDIFSNILTRNGRASDTTTMQDTLTESMAKQRLKRQQMAQSLNANDDKEGRTQ